MLLYHVSYDHLTGFQLRVPRHRVPGEDAMTPRICLTTSIERCINAKPFMAQALYLAREIGAPMALYIYQFQSEDVPDGKLLPPDQIPVPDSQQNQEYWLLDPSVPYLETRLECTGGCFLPPNETSPYAEAIRLDLREEESAIARWIEQSAAKYNQTRKPEERPVTSDLVMVSLVDRIADLVQKDPSWNDPLTCYCT